MDIIGLQWDALAVSEVDSLRYMAGIEIPNYHLNEINSSIWTGTKDGEDGEDWDRTKFHHWYYTGNNPGSSYGVETSARDGYGAYDSVSMYLKSLAALNPSTPADHIHGDATVYTEMLPFYDYFRGHYGKPLFLSIIGKVHSSGTWAANAKITVNQYNASYVYQGTTTMTLISGPAAGVLGCATFKTAAALSSNTVYLQLLIGVTGTNVSLDINRVTMGINPLNNDLATAGSPELYVDVDPFLLSAYPTGSFEARGMKTVMMGSGTTYRTSMMHGPKVQFGLSWYRENDELTQAMQAAQALGTQSPAWGEYVPKPVPLMMDIGVGGWIPKWGYFRPKNAGLGLGFNQYWQTGSEGYDFTMDLEEL